MTNGPELPFDIACHDVKQLLEGSDDLLLLDCRTGEEWTLVRIEGATLIPIEEIQSRAAELEPHRERRIVVHCHHGGRSRMVVEWLRGRGFARAQNMTGGIDVWAQQIDPQLPRY